MVRLGLCCTFLAAPIRFRTTTVRYALSLDSRVRRGFLNELALHNAAALTSAIEWCIDHDVGAFRVQSGLLPLYTHPEVGWTLDGEEGAGVRAALAAAGQRARDAGVRLSFHPDQFVVPGSTSKNVVKASLRELEYIAEVGELIGADQMTIHGGGAQGGKPEALKRLLVGLADLSPRARSLVALENDDRTYHVEDLLPICEGSGIPLIYDVHHHRCNPDSLSVQRATELAAKTWGLREPWVHLSSPLAGWRDGDPRPHADFIKSSDVPAFWLDRTMTIDVEAKAKEKAVLRLKTWIDAQAARGKRTRSSA
ncbi:MAG TPA: UV DNA damage repair endonuclease UvsE [Kofleriaceae bacterium]|nr:UV DNA damage repair endonuclease UvsE [Kofleriaceae bacterium]